LNTLFNKRGRIMDDKQEVKIKNLEKSVVDIIEQMVQYIDKQDAKEENK